MSRQRIEYSHFESVLRMFVGFGRRYSIADGVKATGIVSRTWDAYLSGECEPAFRKLRRIKAWLGAEFVAALYADLGFAVIAAPTEVCPKHYATQTARVQVAVSEAMEDDGVIDADEMREIGSIVTEQALAGLALVGKLAEHVVCHGSGRIDASLIPKYGSPFAIETATFKLAAAPAAASVEDGCVATLSTLATPLV